MKTIKKFLIVSLFLCAISSYGQRVLTPDERQSLIGSSLFIQKCEMSARDYASFWSVNDGSAANTEALKIKWAKDRQLSVDILLKDVSDGRISIRFINLAKGKQFNIGPAPQPVEVLIAAWVTENSFDEFVGGYFTLLGDNINMSIGN